MTKRHLKETSRPRCATAGCEELNDGSFLGMLGYRKCMKGSKISPEKFRVFQAFQKGAGN